MFCCLLPGTPLYESYSRTEYTNYARIKEIKMRLHSLRKEYRKTKRCLFMSKLKRSATRNDLTNRLHHLEKEKTRLKYALDNL